MLKCRLVKFCLVFVSIFAIAACASPEKKMVEQKCNSRCHNTSIIFNKTYSQDQWKNTIIAMKVRGMHTTDDEDALILKYLVEHHGLKQTK